jgi:hypothetical protein
MIYVFGPNSRLFNSLELGLDYKGISLKNDIDDDIYFVDGDVLLFFSDPPSAALTFSRFSQILIKIPKNAKIKIIYISSVSVESSLGCFPNHESGPYRERKKMAENLFLSRSDLEVHVLRVGNVLRNSNWENVITSSKFVVLPIQCQYSAVANLVDIKNYISSVFFQEFTLFSKVVPMYSFLENSQAFQGKVRYSKFLSVLYQYNSSILLKIIAKTFSKIKVFIPSPDDINSVCLHEK